MRAHVVRTVTNLLPTRNLIVLIICGKLAVWPLKWVVPLVKLLTSVPVPVTYLRTSPANALVSKLELMEHKEPNEKLHLYRGIYMYYLLKTWIPKAYI